jgi:hypothetical protein
MVLTTDKVRKPSNSEYFRMFHNFPSSLTGGDWCLLPIGGCETEEKKKIRKFFKENICIVLKQTDGQPVITENTAEIQRMYQNSRFRTSLELLTSLKVKLDWNELHTLISPQFSRYDLCYNTWRVWNKSWEHTRNISEEICSRFGKTTSRNQITVITGQCHSSVG